jgi:hypothetical protein
MMVVKFSMHRTIIVPVVEELEKLEVMVYLMSLLGKVEMDYNF